MYYAKYEGSDQNDLSILDGVTLWRYFTADDVRNYSTNLVNVRDWLAKARSRLGPKITDDFFSSSIFSAKKNLAPALPPELAAMQYFARAGWPDDLLRRFRRCRLRGRKFRDHRFSTGFVCPGCGD